MLPPKTLWWGEASWYCRARGRTNQKNDNKMVSNLKISTMFTSTQMLRFSELAVGCLTSIRLRDHFQNLKDQERIRLWAIKNFNSWRREEDLLGYQVVEVNRDNKIHQETQNLERQWECQPTIFLIRSHPPRKLERLIHTVLEVLCMTERCLWIMTRRKKRELMILKNALRK